MSARARPSTGSGRAVVGRVDSVAFRDSPRACRTIADSEYTTPDEFSDVHVRVHRWRTGTIATASAAASADALRPSRVRRPAGADHRSGRVDRIGARTADRAVRA